MCFHNSVLIVFVLLIGSELGCGSLHSEQSAPPARVQQCRETCLEKFATEDFACLQGPECSMCWDQCAEMSKPNSADQSSWSLKTVSMIRHGSLVSAEVLWPSINAPTQCLVTWEVFGGGLMGNLLTDSTTVQLSLWPDTVYQIQVTCKNKKTEVITRSLPLTLDTSQAFVMVLTENMPSSYTSPLPSPLKNTVPHPPPASTKYKAAIKSMIEKNKIIKKFKNSVAVSSSSIIFDEKSTKSTIDSLQSHPSSDNRKESLYHYSDPTQNNRNNSFSVKLFYNRHETIMLGFCAAMFAFSIVLVIFISFYMNRRKFSNDKELLITNEVNPDFSNNHTVHV